MCDIRKIIKNIDILVFWNFEVGYIRGLIVNFFFKFNGFGYVENRKSLLYKVL